MPSMPRFLLIGLDGAEHSLLERWMREGHLPHLARLLNEGAFMPCASVTPPATFPAWTTCVTGVNPGRHGVFDFTTPAPGAYALRFTNATYRRAPALWNVLSKAGRRVCVLGVPATYPPEPVNGVLVSGFDSPVATRVDRSFVYPPAYYPRVRDWRFADFQESHIGPGWHAQALPKLLEGIAIKQRIACELLAEEPWDFFMLVFGESDTVAHHFWAFHDPASPRASGQLTGFEDAVLRVYARLDEAVGALESAAGGDCTVGVVSDHGFGGAGTGVVHLNNWLAEQGLLAFASTSDSWLKGLALATIPSSWQGRLFRRFHGLASKAESRSRFGGIHWPATRAWSEELNYFPSIRVNLRGREALGQVEPSDYGAFCTDLCATLEAWPPVAKAWRREELYEGPYVSEAPDIILELALEDGYSHACLRSRGGPCFRRIGPAERLGGKERGMNGSHRPTGVLFLSEPSLARRASLFDVAPTVLARLGVQGPPLEGVDLFRQDALPHSGDVFSDVEMPPAPYSEEEERIIEERLRALGYLE